MSSVRGTFFGIVCAATFSSLCAAGCSSDSGTSSNTMSSKSAVSFCSLGPACRKIAMTCMPKDDGAPGTVHDCHVLGMETGIESQCEQKLDSCTMACNAAPALGNPPMMPKCDGGS